MEFERDRYYRLTVQREGEDSVEYVRFRFDNQTAQVVMDGETQAVGNVAQAERDVAQAERDVAQAERDTAQRERDVAQRERDVAQRERDLAQAQGDADQAEGDAAQAEGDAEKASEEGASRMFPHSLVFIDQEGSTQRLYEHEIKRWELLPD
jgi:hypothetical protein